MKKRSNRREIMFNDILISFLFLEITQIKLCYQLIFNEFIDYIIT